MTTRKSVLLLVLLGFGGITILALMDVGYFGLFTPSFKSWGGAQVLVDLVIVCLLACFWMIADARKRGLAAWPFVLITLLAGSFGPLLYLLRREWVSPTQ